MAENEYSDAGQYRAARDAKMDQIRRFDDVVLMDGSKLYVRDLSYKNGTILLSDGSWHYVEEIA